MYKQLFKSMNFLQVAPEEVMVIWIPHESLRSTNPASNPQPSKHLLWAAAKALVQLATSASCRGKRRKHGGNWKKKTSLVILGAANLEFHVHFISSAVSELREPILCLRKAFRTPGLWKQREGGSLSPASNRIQPRTLAQILQPTKGGSLEVSPDACTGAFHVYCCHKWTPKIG